MKSRLFFLGRTGGVAVGILLLLLSYSVAYAVDVIFTFDSCAGNNTKTVTSPATGSNYDIQVVAVTNNLLCDSGWIGSSTFGATQLTFSLVGGPSFTLNSFQVIGPSGSTLRIAPDGDSGKAETFVSTGSPETFTPANQANFSNITSFEITKDPGGLLADYYFSYVSIPFSPTAVELERLETSSGGSQIAIDLLLAGICFAGLTALIFTRRRWASASGRSPSRA